MLRTADSLAPLRVLCHGASPPGFRPMAAVSYGAAWPLPRPDFHRQADRDFAGHTRTNKPPHPLNAGVYHHFNRQALGIAPQSSSSLSSLSCLFFFLSFPFP